MNWEKCMPDWLRHSAWVVISKSRNQQFKILSCRRMIITFYIAIFLLLVYGILFQFYNSWWKALPDFNVADAAYTPSVKISVIIPARNEEENIAACLHSICQQNYPGHLFQVILVDDNSTDNTFQIANNISYKGIQIICTTLAPADKNTAPKKRAIETGIAMASGELIVTTDADCIAGPNWLQSIAAFHHQSKNIFIAAPVKIKDGSSLLSRFQALDFLTMQGITAAAVFKRFHNMCNGANLAYEKKIFYEVDGFTGIDNIASGDDMLLMNKVFKKYPQQIGFVKSPAAIITTLPATSWKAFFQQRIRWASKATHYNQRGIFLVLLLVYLTNLFIFCFLLMAFWQKFAIILFVLLCVAKFFMELFFVKDVAVFFQQQYLVPWLLLLQPLHIIYMVVSGFLGQFKTYEWKGRKLK
jgi:cellulose synthase/poly-beta-1,6-N-acetylglucosamine synthase-like glycosyltransferase